MPTLVDHLEAHLGLIDCGWSVSPDGDPLGFQVVRFGSSKLGWLAYSTLGLSKVSLCSGVSGKTIRHELIVLAPAGFGDRNIPAVLQDIATEAIKRAHAYLCGEVIGPRGNLFDGFPFTAFYVTSPVYLPDSFASFEGETEGSIIFAWLVPITDTEAQFVATRGWKAFEELLEQRDPNLVDFTRPAVL